MVKKILLTRTNEIKPYLDRPFVILFGSAVSGALSPKLPMINDFTHTFLKQVATRLYSGSMTEQIAAGYALALVDGYHEKLLNQTKFENFIFRLQSSIGKNMVDDLFIRLYSCNNKQYNANHSAIAFLLKKRVCSAALTTNFDNALETCLSSLKVYVHPDKPACIPFRKGRPTLIKLHGDALSKTCVATSPQLAKAKAYASNAYIESLLYDQIVLVFGYSGTGDIDIAPHLGKNERLLLWGNYAFEGSSMRLNNQVDFLCDLSLPQPGMEKEGRRNLLLDLAAEYGWKEKPVTAIEESQKWEEEIIDWVNQIPTEHLHEFVASFMSWSTSWPHVHISYFSVKDQTYTKKLEYAEAAAQVSAYNSSERLLAKMVLNPPPNLEEYIIAIGLLGFTYWRQTRYQKALSTLMLLLKIYEQLIREWKAIPDMKTLGHISNIARNYLEIVIEMMHNKRKDSERRRIAQNADTGLAIRLLRSFKYERNYYLNQIALLEMDHWLSDTISTKETRDFFNECMAMEEWSAAALTVQFLLVLSFSDGYEAFSKLIPHLRKRRSAKLIFKIYASLYYEKFNRLVPMQILNLRLFRFLSTLFVETIFSLKRLLWKVDILLNQTRVEAGFIHFGKVLRRK